MFLKNAGTLYNALYEIWLSMKLLKFFKMIEMHCGQKN